MHYLYFHAIRFNSLDILDTPVLLEISAVSAIFVTAVASSGVTKNLVILPDKSLKKVF